MTDNDTQNRGNGPLSRRRFVQTVGAAGLTAGLAGCGGQQAASGSEGGEGMTSAQGTAMAENGTVDQSGTPADDALTLAQWAVPSDSQYNPYNGKNYAEPRRMLFDRLMMYNLAKGEFQPYALSEWQTNVSESETTLSMTVREGMTWHDGSPVTADDLVTQLKLDMYTGSSLADYVERIDDAIEKTGKRSATLTLTPVNERIVLSLVQPTRLAAKADVYGKFLTNLQDADGEEAKNQALSDLTGFTVSDPIGNGPFQFENADSQRTLLTKFDDSPWADNINFPEAEYLYMPSNQKRWNALINDRTDGSATLFMPQNKLQQLDSAVRVAKIPRHWGLGVIFNHAREPWNDPTVRRALTYVIDRKLVAKNSGAGTDTKIPVDIPSGLTGNFSGKVTGKWLSPDSEGAPEQFDRYGTDTEKAASLLEKAGYSKEGGTWVDSNGAPLEAPLKAPAGFSDWVAAARTMVSQLDSFGIKAQLLTKDTSTYWGQDYPNSDFDLALNGWASYDHTYPYFHFQTIWTGDDARNVWNVPKTVTVPPFDDPSGEPREVNPNKLVEQLSTASGENARTLIQRLAWVTNQSMPVIPIQEKLAQSFMTTDDWNVPPADSEKVMEYWPTEWLPRKGWWTAKMEGKN